MKTEDAAREHVRRFIAAIVEAAFLDASENVPPRYAPRNSGKRLVVRLNLDQYRISPRKGDAKYARSIYTAARWLLKTETP